MSDTTRAAPTGEPSDRAQQLLRTLVECYVRDGQPVGSRTLTRESGLSLSAATIRNVMADLEEHGFVASPHTSAGRMPTDKGYRYFVDALLRFQPPDQAEVAELKHQLEQRAGDHEGARRGGLAAGVGPHAPRWRRDRAARNPFRAVADRVRRAVR